MHINDIPNDDTGQAIKRWAEEGSDLAKPMKIDFFVEVVDDVIGGKLSSDIALAEFNISIEQDNETGRWTCYCTKTLIPDYQAIVRIESLLMAVVKKFGASYEGFGSYGNAGM